MKQDMNRKTTIEQNELSGIDRSIDRFVAGEMSSNERAQFEAQLSLNRELQELVSADRVIQRYSTNAISNVPASTPSIVSPALQQYLLSVRPKKLWVSYVAAASYAVVIAVVLLSLYSGRPTGSIPPARTPVVATDTITHAKQPSTSNMPTLELPKPAQHSVPSVTPTEPAPLQQPAQERQPARDFAEPSGPPRVYESDSVAVRIHAK